MKISSVRIKNYKSIKDTGDISLSSDLLVLAGQNESGKSSILEALDAYENNVPDRDKLNFELENKGNLNQEITCTYDDLDDEFYNSLIQELVSKYDFLESEDSEPESIFDVEAIKRIKKFSLTRKFQFTYDDSSNSLSIDKSSLQILRNAIIKETGKQDNDSEDKESNTEEAEAGESSITLKDYLNNEENIDEIADCFWTHTPTIVLFNDFKTLLPDKILLSELDSDSTQGIEAVKNLENLIDSSFSKIASKNIPQKNSSTQTESETLSANFQSDWNQKIYGNNKVNIKFFIENNEEGEKEISFFVETKDNEYLSPRKRSKGMIWFLSLWLELKAKEDHSNLVLLFDEPGLHLHIKACRDMLSIFHRLSKKGHQIVFSTHSPSLIETDQLHNIRLVINDKKKGTLIEGLTTTKINSENKRDALQPVAEAMGMQPLRDFSVLSDKNVLVEGISDYWYMLGMQKLLNRKSDYQLIPMVGVKGSKLFPHISFCIGYGFDWLLIMDNGKIPIEKRKEICDSVFEGNENEADKKIKLLKSDHIEDLLNPNDLKLVDPSLTIDDKKTPIEIIGSKRKILFSRLFIEKVNNKEITRQKIHKNTVNQFEEIFDWIDKGLKK